MENNKSDLTKPLSASEARADNASGLPSVFAECGGVDIQPLEDIKPEKMLPFEDNTESVSDESAESPDKQQREKKHSGKKLVRAAVIILLLCAVGFAGYKAFWKFNDYAHPAVAVYQKGDKTEVLLDNDRRFELEKVVDAVLSDDGNILVYFQESTTKTGKFDMRVVELKKRSSVKNKGTLAVSGIEEGWKVSGDCSYVYYSVAEENNQHYYAYVTGTRQTQPLVSNAEEVFFPPEGDIVYFTRGQGNNFQLFKIRVGEKASAIDDVCEVKAFSDEEKLEIFYTVQNISGTYRLYKISQGAEPLEIAPDISEVNLGDYQIGGNLYYFVKSESRLNWSDFIDDSYVDSDAEMKRPDKEDYTYTVGFIFKRKKVDESAYNLAVQKYDRKTVRDSVRAALNQADLGLALSSEYKVKVFDGEKSRELAGGVKLENLMAYSKTGMPRIIVKKSGIGSSEKISMDTLYDLALKSSPEMAVNYAIETLRDNGYEINDGYKYSYSNGDNVYEYSFNPMYDTTEAVFLLGGKNSVFAAVKTDRTHYTIFFSRVENGAFTPEKAVAENVVSFDCSKDMILAAVESQNANDLYACYGDGSTVNVCKNFVDYQYTDDSLIVTRTQTDTSDTAKVELIIYKDKNTSDIDGGVYPENIVVKNEKIAYIKNYEPSGIDSDSYGGKMIIYGKNKKLTVGETVSRIFDIS